MKVIFLDIDGVLNTQETYNRIYKVQGYIPGFDIEVDNFRIEYLKTIIDYTGAKIVLSSSFRHFFIKQEDKVIPVCLKGKKLYNTFLKYGIEIHDVTPVTNSSREEEIKIWLDMNKDVEDFVIIDDDPTGFYEFSNKLIQTSKVKNNYLLSFIKDSFGLCERHIPEIIDRLNTKRKTM